jgi:uncharacterized SAM-dependent methyltransferase
MGILKNSRVATKYRVSNPTVGKWITAAQDRKNNLEITKVKNKNYILDTEANHKELAFLAERGGKYKNKIGYELVEPNPEFYKIFNESQIIDIIINLRKKILPYKYFYWGQGSSYWDRFVNNRVSIVNDEEYKGVKSIDLIFNYILYRLGEYKSINLIDIGSGNGYPAKQLIQRVKNAHFKVDYSALDLSQDLLDILSKNMDKWYPEINKSYVKHDIEFDLLRNLLYSPRNKKGEKGCNLVTMLGCTISNFPDIHRILRNISDSMSVGDYLLMDFQMSSKQDYENTRVGLGQPEIRNLSTWLIEMLGINKDNLNFEVKYDEYLKANSQIYTLKKDIDIKIIVGKTRDIISLRQGDKIRGLFVKSYDINELLQEVQSASLFVDNLSFQPEKSEALMMCEIVK